jgi:hypothetical protein
MGNQDRFALMVLRHASTNRVRRIVRQSMPADMAHISTRRRDTPAIMAISLGVASPRASILRDARRACGSLQGLAIYPL